MKINILLCDTFPGFLPDYIQSYAEMFVNLFKSVCPTVKVSVFFTFLGEFPNPDDEDIFLITGCNKSAYDDIPWIHKLQDWIQIAFKNRSKLIGICFGHQIIAQALGGKVERAKEGWGVGIRESHVVDAFSADLFGDKTLSLLYNHHDQVTILPPNAIRVATSDFCINEGFRIGHQVVTFQGHPEYTVPYAEHLLIHHAEGEDPRVVEQALASLQTKIHKGSSAARFILEMMGI